MPPSKWSEIVSIGILYVLPILIGAFEIFPATYANEIGGIFVLIILLNSLVTGQLKKIKIIGAWRSSISHNLILTAVILVILYMMSRASWFASLQNPVGGITSPALIPAYIFIVAPLQQLIFFGDLSTRLRIVTSNSHLRLILNVMLYSLIHLYYPEPWFIIIGTSLLGSLWYVLSQGTGSIVGNSISHAIIGIVAIYLGLA